MQGIRDKFCDLIDVELRMDGVRVNRGGVMITMVG